MGCLMECSTYYINLIKLINYVIGVDYCSLYCLIGSIVLVNLFIFYNIIRIQEIFSFIANYSMHFCFRNTICEIGLSRKI